MSNEFYKRDMLGSVGDVRDENVEAFALLFGIQATNGIGMAVNNIGNVLREMKEEHDQRSWENSAQYDHMMLGEQIQQEKLREAEEKAQQELKAQKESLFQPSSNLSVDDIVDLQTSGPASDYEEPTPNRPMFDFPVYKPPWAL